LAGALLGDFLADEAFFAGVFLMVFVFLDTLAFLAGDFLGDYFLGLDFLVAFLFSIFI
jgi:hypothetical protein